MNLIECVGCKGGFACHYCRGQGWTRIGDHTASLVSLAAAWNEGGIDWQDMVEAVAAQCEINDATRMYPEAWADLGDEMQAAVDDCLGGLISRELAEEAAAQLTEAAE